MTDKFAERYEGNFLEAADIPEGAEAKVEIAAVVPPDSEKDKAGKVIKKAIVQFHGRNKRLVLGKTNYRVLKMLFGAQPEQWVGKEVVLQRRYLDAAHGFGVHNEMCLRILPPIGTPIPKNVRDYLGTREPQPERSK